MGHRYGILRLGDGQYLQPHSRFVVAVSDEGEAVLVAQVLDRTAGAAMIQRLRAEDADPWRALDAIEEGDAAPEPSTP